MARDYAKGRSSGRSGGARRSSGKSSSWPLPGWVWLVFGLSIGLVVAAVAYIVRPKTHVATVPAHPAPKQAENARIPLPPKQPSRYSFYDMLPSYEVVIPRKDAAAAARNSKAATPDIASPGQYVIQVGAYRSHDEADRSRANLALLGIESRIEQVTIDEKDIWYRVRIGPEDSLAKAQDILDRLDQNGIKAVLMKVKSG
jgi:cell division protein FtsN